MTENIPPNIRNAMQSLTPKPDKAKQSIEETYVKLSHLDQILTRPDTYIGSIEPETEETWIWREDAEDDSRMEVIDSDDEDVKSKPSSSSSTLHGHMEMKKTTIVPGLFKIFDEILVNAADHRQRCKTMKTLKVEINADNNSISVYNDGDGIPVAMHQKEKVYVPELIFGQLLTSSNYNDNDKKTVGGKNGYGAKLANIFSTKFVVETLDSDKGKLFKQIYRNNMKVREEPTIKSTAGKSYTKITFYPDLQRFGMQELDDDIIGLMMRRVIDIAGTSKPGLKVFINGKKVEVNSFLDYCTLYLGNSEDTVKLYERIPFQAITTADDKAAAKANSSAEKVKVTSGNTKDYWWEVVVSASTDYAFQQVSFVNGINTSKGGTHVNAITDQLTKYIAEWCTKKHKAASVKPQHIKQNLFVFVNCLIVNPAFDSQTKTNLTTKKSNFGSSCEVEEKFLKKLTACQSLIDTILSQADKKNQNALNKQNAKKNAGKLRGIPKLDDANLAGTKHGHECTLILTEGDSAKALAVSGLAVVGRDRFGVFPLRGKLLNVRDEAVQKVRDNKEISCLLQILGLRHHTNYTSTRDSGLRYGHVMIMTDQDYDGSHIKGLVINLFAKFWPSLLKLNGYLREFITPIVKATKSHQELAFYTIPEYETWRSQHDGGKGWKLKYYKGLGTSTSSEAKQYFTDIGRHDIEFYYRDITDEEAIELAFGKSKVEQRKEWLANVAPDTYLNQDVDKIRYTDFVHKELVLFSLASNVRAIPSVVDGFKPGQRKIIFAALKFKLSKEIKVAQLGGLVAKEAAYHHGEQSLSSTIVVMAQNHIGSNNINVLYPSGQFGTRLAGGKDAASARYIFTYLSPITRTIFHESDDQLLNYLNDDGQSIEPEYYVPVLPMVLINGSSGIGTGWSSTVPNYNPREIIRNLKLMLNGGRAVPMHPFYKGFTGTIVSQSQSKYVVYGKISKIDELTYHITELPVNVWTSDYKQMLEDYAKDGHIVDFREYHTDTTVSFVIYFNDEQIAAALKTGLYQKFKLTGSITTSNMVLFNSSGKLRRYDTPLEILDEFYALRLDHYHRRKAAMTEKMQLELQKITNKCRFIMAVIKDELNIRNIKRQALLQRLVKDGYAPVPKGSKRDDAPIEVQLAEEAEEERQRAEDETVTLNGAGSSAVDSKVKAVRASDYDYLLSMPLWNLTMEKVQEMQQDKQTKEEELATLLATTPQDLWRVDLELLEAALDAHEQHEHEEVHGRRKNTVTPVSKKGKTISKLGNSKGNAGKKMTAADLPPGTVIDPPVVNFKASPEKRKTKDVKVEGGVKSEDGLTIKTESDKLQRTMSNMFKGTEKVKKEPATKPAKATKSKMVLDSDDDNDDGAASDLSDADIDEFLTDGDSDDDSSRKLKQKSSSQVSNTSDIRKSPNRRAATKPVNYRVDEESEDDMSFEAESDDDGDEASEDDDSDVKPKKAAASKPVASKKKKLASDLDDDDSGSDASEVVAAPKPRAALPSKPAATKPAAATTKTHAKSASISVDSDDEAPKGSLFARIAGKKATANTATTKKSTFDIDDSDVEMEESKEPPKPKPAAKAPAVKASKPAATKRKSSDDGQSSKAAKKATAAAATGKSAVSSYFTASSKFDDSGSDVDIASSDEEDFKPTKKKAATKPAAASKPSSTTSAKPAASRPAAASKPAPKKSKYVEESDDDDISDYQASDSESDY